jgi:NTE family protein
MTPAAPPANPEPLDVGVVVAGAGARGAYEAGLLAHLLPEVAARSQAEGRVVRFSFIGTSAGALNAALIASRAPRIGVDADPHDVRTRWADTMTEVGQVWRRLTEGHILGPRLSGRLIGALTRALPLIHLPLVSALDVNPLVELTSDHSVIDWPGLHDRVNDRTIGAIAVTTTARDGRTVLFLDRHDGIIDLPRDRLRDVDYVDVTDGLAAQHVLASSAIPALFPAQWIDTPEDWAGWYVDGGVRLNTPLKPALALGLDHLVIVGTHPGRYDRPARPDQGPSSPEIDEALLPVVNQLMVDQLIQDMETLRRRNTLSGSTVVKHVFAGPPGFDTLADLSRTTATNLGATRLLRGMLTGPARWELSSYMLFDPGYLGAAFESGRSRASHPDILPDMESVRWQT